MRAIEKTVAPKRRQQVATFERDRELGMLYLAAQPHIARSNYNAKDWCDIKLGIPYRRIADCAYVAENWPDCMTADHWYHHGGGYSQEGWRVVRKTGAEYLRQVLDYHRRSLRGEKPGDRDAAKAARAQERREQRAAEIADQPKPTITSRDDFEQQIEELEEARVIQRENFELAAAAARRHRNRNRAMLRQVQRLRARAIKAEVEVRVLRGE
jgi:hypothetical protein